MNLRNRFNLRSVVFGAMLALVTAACSNRSSGTGSVITGNHVTADQATTERQVGDSSTQFAVLGKSALMEAIASGRILASGSHAGSAALNKIATASTEGPSNEEPAEEPSVPTDPATAAPTLTVGYPIDLLGEYVVFGGVITKVSDTKSEDLGMLKLTDLTPIHARPSVARDSGGNFFLVLHGCVQACTETSTQLELLAIPVVGVDTKAGVIFLDLSVLGKEMNLVEMLDPNGLFTGLKTKTSVVSAIDFSVSTLVFDVEANMIPVQSDPADPDEKGTTFTTRWYLKLTSGFNPAFVARAATPGVGFFVTDRSAEPKIHRFSQYALGTGATAQPKVLYYIKDVPSQYRPAFAAAFDNWNEKFTDVIGRKLVEYEFVDATDPRHAHLVAGDIRYNIVEWDLVNNAPYGGLGPSIANQHTGEIFSANVLIQGPRVVEIYTKWFSDATTATNLRENGNVEEADSLLRQSSKELEKLAAVGKRKGKIDLTLGKHLQFRVTSQLPSLEDPVSAPDSFDEVPAGVTFDSYMAGYFQEMVEHELGHNLGLRHNFHGNLGAKPGPATFEGVSHSVMEYLGRGFRHLDRIGPYDVMAIGYGYAGKKPDKLNLFCTDEDVAIESNLANSAECSRDDATNDPFSYLTSRVKRAVTLVLAPESTAKPVFAVKDIEGQLATAVKGLALYAGSAELTASKWQNFFTGGSRPADASGVKGYVVSELKGLLCDPKFADIVAAKVDDEAKQATEANITALREKAGQVVTLVRGLSSADLACTTTP